MCASGGGEAAGSNPVIALDSSDFSRALVTTCNPTVTAPSRAASAPRDFTRTKTHKSPGEPRLGSFGENGAGEAIRTLDPNLGKVVLYP